MDLNLLTLSREQLKWHIIEYGEKHNLSVCFSQHYILFINHEANANLTLVSHYDTVAKPPTCKQIKRRGAVVYTTGDILGADDRAGVWLCLELSHYTKYTLFCDLEEVGGIGAQEFCQQNPDFHTNAFIELDRKGENDAVFYDNISTDFYTFIMSYGWQEAVGSFSDISILTPYYNIPSVNLSVGYRYQHTKYETLDLNILNQTYERVKQMLLEYDNRQFKVDVDLEQIEFYNLLKLYGYDF